MSQFVELNEAMGVPKEDVGVIIANVKATLDRSAKVHSNFFRTVETQCASALARINSQLTGLKNAITDATSNQNQWIKNKATAEADRKDANANLAKAKVQLKGLKKRIAKLTMDYRVYATEADRKINVVKVLRDIISDELFNRAPGALVQVNKFQEKLNELKNLLNNNSDSLYAPMISVLLDLATEQNFSDQSVLKKILQQLKSLDQALRDFRTKQEKSLDAEMGTIRKEIKNVKARIRAYRRMRHQAASKLIDASHYITFYSHEISHFNAETTRVTNGLNLFKKLCDFEKGIHKATKAATQRFKNVVVPRLFKDVQQLK